MQIQAEQPHNIILEKRRELRISGVKDIDSFTETRIILNTVMGELVIKGQDLHVINLDNDTGNLHMNGSISSMVYNNYKTTDNVIKKLFR